MYPLLSVRCRLYESSAYSRDCLSIVHSSFVEDCVRRGSVSDVPLDRYFMPAQKVYEGIFSLLRRDHLFCVLKPHWHWWFFISHSYKRRGSLLLDGRSAFGIGWGEQLWLPNKRMFEVFCILNISSIMVWRCLVRYRRLEMARSNQKQGQVCEYRCVCRALLPFLAPFRPPTMIAFCWWDVMVDR